MLTRKILTKVLCRDAMETILSFIDYKQGNSIITDYSLCKYNGIYEDCEKVEDIDSGMLGAISSGNYSLSLHFLYKGAKMFEDGLAQAVKYGRLEFSKLMIEKGAKKLDYAFFISCAYGHLDIVKFLLTLNIHSINNGLIEGARGGYIDIVKYLIEKGADNFKYALIPACNGGHLEIVKYILELPKSSCFSDIPDTMNSACLRGHVEVVKYLIFKGNRSFDTGIYNACKGGHLHVVKLLCSYGAFIPREAVPIACEYEHVQLLKYLLELNNPLEINRGFNIACYYGKIEAVKIIINYGGIDRNNIVNGFLDVCVLGYINIIKMFIASGYSYVNEGLRLVCELTGDIDVANCLLEYGADNYDIALELAQSNGYANLTNHITTYRLT